MTFIRTGSIALVLAAGIAGAAAQAPSPFPNPPPSSTFAPPNTASPFPNPPPAATQFSNPNASPFPNPGASPFPNPGQPAPPAGVDPNVQCAKFMPLRQAAEKKAAAINVAMQRKAGPQEACGLLRSFYDSEGLMLKFLQDNAGLCGVPPTAIQQIKDSHARTATARAQVCQAAAAPKPQGQTLGEALGATRIPDSTTTRTGRGGALDTLTGNPISR